MRILRITRPRLEKWGLINGRVRRGNKHVIVFLFYFYYYGFGGRVYLQTILHMKALETQR